MFKHSTILRPVYKPTLKREKTMTEITKDVYIGTEEDYEYHKLDNNTYFINACKYPYWVEYAKYNCNNGLYGYKGNRMICNLVDADDEKYIPREIIEKCLEYIEKGVKEGKKVIINCNEGRSRSATIGLIYLINKGLIEGDTLHEIMMKYEEIVPRYNPRLGMLTVLREYYDKYRKIS